MNQPKISVIVPIYNSEHFLDKCIQSIINQTYRNIEIILINDGSTDKSLDICYKFKKIDERIIVLNKKNGGVSSARNMGLDIASGDYIGFIDSDDFIATNMYENMLHAIIKHNADVAECGYFTCDSNYKNIRKYELINSVIDGEYMCSYLYLTGENTTNFNVNKLYKRELLYDIRYPNVRYSEDYWLNVRVFYKCKRKVTLKDCYYYYVMSDQSAVRQEFDYSKRKDTIKVALDLYDFHSTRFTNLTPFIALYLCRYILYFYQNINLINDKNKMVKQELRYLFIKYYPKIRNEAYEQLKFMRLHLPMAVFRINPSLYIFLRKLHSQIRKYKLCFKWISQ